MASASSIDVSLSAVPERIYTAASSGTRLHRPGLNSLRNGSLIYPATALVADTVKGGELSYMALAL